MRHTPTKIEHVSMNKINKSEEEEEEEESSLVFERAGGGAPLF